MSESKKYEPPKELREANAAVAAQEAHIEDIKARNPELQEAMRVLKTLRAKKNEIGWRLVAEEEKIKALTELPAVPGHRLLITRRLKK